MVLARFIGSDPKERKVHLADRGKLVCLGRVSGREGSLVVALDEITVTSSEYIDGGPPAPVLGPQRADTHSSDLDHAVPVQLDDIAKASRDESLRAL